MKKDDILKMACTVAAGALSNPVMTDLCNPVNSGPRQQLIHALTEEIKAIVFRMGITIEE
jgi:hypothetical protein